MTTLENFYYGNISPHESIAHLQPDEQQNILSVPTADINLTISKGEKIWYRDI